MKLNKKTIILTSFAVASMMLTSCAHTKKTKSLIAPEKDPRLTAPRPKELPPIKVDCASCFTVRFAVDENNNVRRNKAGQPLIDGLDTPPIKLKGDKEPRIYHTVYKVPVTIEDLPSKGINVALFGTPEKAKELRKILDDVAKKLQAQYEVEQRVLAQQKASATRAKIFKEQKEYKIAIAKERIDRLNKVREKFWNRHKLIKSLTKNNAQVNKTIRNHTAQNRLPSQNFRHSPKF